MPQPISATVWPGRRAMARRTRSGRSSAISGDTVVVGAFTVDPASGGLDGTGAAYVFVKPSGGWAGSLTENAKLVASDRVQNDDFGSWVGISGDTVVVGAPGPNHAAYVFVQPSGGWGAGALWTQTAKLTPSAGGLFGSSVAISGDTIAAGAVADKVGSNTSQGSVCVFVKPAGSWADANETAKLIASDGAAGDSLGVRVAVDGNTVVATTAALNGSELTGAYAFVKPATGWANTVTETGKVVPSVQSDDFNAIAVDGTTMVLGAQGHAVSASRSCTRHTAWWPGRWPEPH